MRYVPLQQFMPAIQQMMDEGTTYPSMRQSLMDSDTGIIAEFKRKSPSKGWIHQDAKAEEVTMAYQQAGATYKP